METYIITLFAKFGEEEAVTKIYAEQEEGMRKAKGYLGRKIWRARDGAMKEVVRPLLSDEDKARMDASKGPPGVHFVILEQWETAEDKAVFSRSLEAGRAKELVPRLLPQHTHEFYEDVTP